MDLLNKTKELCRLYDITPARTKGQNFLIKEEIYDKIIKAAELNRDDVVLEVGPGLGFLTAKLAKRVKKVIAVELDDKLAKILRTGLITQGIKNVEVVNENILDFRFKILDLENKIENRKSKIENFKIVANLPYNITSVFLRKFLSLGDARDRSAEHKPQLMVLMLQKEVAERITARPGEMSLLAVSVQFYAEPKIIQIVLKENFWPEPEVDSAIVRIRPLPTLPFARGGNQKFPLLTKEGVGGGYNEKEFFRLVKIGFSARRKMLKNNLANGYHISQKEAEKWLWKTGFNPKIRAQELGVDDWLKILELKGGNVV